MRSTYLARLLLAAAPALLAVPAAAADGGHLRGLLATTAAPQLLIRQADICEKATDTACADGNGCCPRGEICTYRSGVPLCRGTCTPGVVTCRYNGVTACCPGFGSTCDARSPGFCSATVGGGLPTGGPATLPPFTPVFTSTGGGGGGGGGGGSPSPIPTFGTGAPDVTGGPADPGTTTSTARGGGFITPATTTSRFSTFTPQVQPNPGSIVSSGGLGAFLMAGAALLFGLFFV